MGFVGAGGTMKPTVERLATGRDNSRFAADIAATTPTLREALHGRRVLVIGGAGSIGSATVRRVLPFGPAAVDVVDQDENGLAELVRDVRSAGLAQPATALRCLPLDYGATLTRRHLAAAGRYDVVLHFAALKHVRSEKDAVSVLQMIDTNVLKQRRLLDWLATAAPPARYFAVSTDKAANPANFMGASKRLMEHLLFTAAPTGQPGSVRTSARFANVAFSAGSLLASWRERLLKQQPLAVPRDTRRYFVSMTESAEICLLASLALPANHLAVPRMAAEADLHELRPIAEGFVRDAGYAPVWYESEDEARQHAARDIGAGRWPILTTRDTDGEKAEEVFVGAGEATVEVGWAALMGVAQQGVGPRALQVALDQLEAWVAHPELRADRSDIAAVIASVVPEFAHVASGKSLDDRM